MADETTTATPVAETGRRNAPKLRIFKVAGATIREDANTAGFSIQEMRTRLAYQFPNRQRHAPHASRNAAGEEGRVPPVAGHKG